MGDSRKLKWHEEIFTGLISAAIGVTLILNGFSYLTSLIINKDGIKGGATKEKGLVALFSLLEGGWWKYVISFIFLAIAFYQIREGIRKCSSNK